MSFAKFLFWLTLILFGAIFFAAYLKKPAKIQPPMIQEVTLEETIEPSEGKPSSALLVKRDTAFLPAEDRIEEFFSVATGQSPFVETVVYKSRVPWSPGKSAWIEDYARHYKTSKHFIGRSLYGQNGYFKQDVREGDRFRVLKKDLQFRLVIDLSRLKMWFYAGLPAKESQDVDWTLVKTYPVGLGRLDDNRSSGSLTPIGKYLLGDNIAVYKPETKGLYNGKKIPMVQVFGTRWIPFKKELGDCTAPAKGLGIHGLPWKCYDDGALVEERDSLGSHSSDGCVRLATEDIEELFSIIITKPTTVEIVRDFQDSELVSAMR